MIDIRDIFRSVNETLMWLFPDAKVYKERIRELETPSLSVELVRYATPQFSKDVINKKVDLDIIYYSESNEVGEALSICNKLMSAFSMGLYVRAYEGEKMVDKRYIHCLKAPEYTLVDQDLHFLVTYEFADGLRNLYLADDKEVKEFYEDTRASEDINVKDYIDGKTTEIKISDNPNDGKEFVKDVDFNTIEDKKAYEDEGLKYMEEMKLQYKL